MQITFEGTQKDTKVEIARMENMNGQLTPIERG